MCLSGAGTGHGAKKAVKSFEVMVWALMLAVMGISTARGANIPWATAASGDFSIGGNWTGGAAPGTGDTAQFNVAGLYTVTLDVNPTNLGVSVGGSDVIIDNNTSGRTWTLSSTSAALTINSGSMSLNAAAPIALNTDHGTINAPLQIYGGSDLSSSSFINVGTSGTLGSVLVDGAGTSLTTTSGALNIASGAATGAVTFQNNATGTVNQLAVSNTASPGATGSLTIQSGADVTVTNNFATASIGVGAIAGQSASVNVTGAGSSLSFLGGGNMTVGGVGNVTVSSGAALTFGTGTLTIRSGGLATIQSGSTLNAGPTIRINDTAVASGLGKLVVTGTGSSGSSGSLLVGNSGTGEGELEVLSGATYTSGGNIIINSTGLIDIAGGSFAHNGSGAMTVGINSPVGGGMVSVGSGGTFTTATGTTTVERTGAIDINGGTFNANGPITLNGGSLTCSGTFNWVPGKQINVLQGAEVNFNGVSFTTPANSFVNMHSGGSQFNVTGNGQILWVSNGAEVRVFHDSSMSAPQVLVGVEGNGVLWVDGPDASLTVTGPCAVGQGQFNTGTLLVVDGATATTGMLLIGTGYATGTVTVGGPGSSLTQTGTAPLTMGDPLLGPAELNVSNGGVFTSGTGLTTVRTTAAITNDSGTINFNGDILIDGGTLERTIHPGAAFTWAAGKTMDVMTEGKVNLPGTAPYSLSNGNVINVTGDGSLMSLGGTFNMSAASQLNASGGGDLSAASLTVGGGATLTVNGSGSTATLTGAASYTLGDGSGSNDTINLSNGASLTANPASTLNLNATGVLNVTGATVSLGTVNGNGGAINLNAGSTGTFAGDVDLDSGSTLAVSAGASAAFSGHIRVNGLTVNGTATVSADGSAAGVNLADTLMIGTGGALDLADNDLVVNNGSFTQIYDWVIAGFGNPAGITSSTSDGSQILALFDNALVGASAWEGHAIAANAIVGKYTYFGDANFDGQVSGDDYTVIDANLGTDPTVGIEWLSGDGNLDGIVTGDDYTVVDANLGLGAGNPLSAVAMGSVPEPAGFALLAWGAPLLWGRRRRSVRSD